MAWVAAGATIGPTGPNVAAVGVVAGNVAATGAEVADDNGVDCREELSSSLTLLSLRSCRCGGREPRKCLNVRPCLGIIFEIANRIG